MSLWYGKRMSQVMVVAMLCALLALLVIMPQTALAEAAEVDVLFDGTVTLVPGESFTISGYPVDCDTPLGALQAAAIAKGFTYVVGDKKYEEHGILLLDDIGDYPYGGGGNKWYAYVNGVFKDGFDGAEYALNLIKLADGDKVEFYYVAGVNKTDYDAVKAAATAAVKMVADTGGAVPTDWTLRLSGAKDESVTKANFEQGLACHSSHSVAWTDDNGDVWGGVPLYLLVGMVDDDPDAGPAHYNFNCALAEQGYSIKVIAGDGWDTTLDSAAVAQGAPEDYIVANTLNGDPLPVKTDAGKGCWPLHLKGAKINSGQQVGNIVRIELTGLPEPPAGWTLEIVGKVGDVITQAEFEEGLACTSGHRAEWTDKDGHVWSGVPLWVLLGAVDDIEKGSHWTFNNDAADAGYTVKVIAGDGFSKTFHSADVKHSNDYIIANKVDGELLEGDSASLRLVGTGVAKEDGSLSGSAVGNIVRIEIPELQTPEAAGGSWNLKLTGKISYVLSQAEFEADGCHTKIWTDGEGQVWSGVPLRLLAGWVDDRTPHAFDANQAAAGYTLVVQAGDGYGKDFTSQEILNSADADYIVASKCDGEPLIGKSAPLRLVGAGVANSEGGLGGNSVGGIAEIKLINFGVVQPPQGVHIVKYAEDRVTVLEECTVDYQWLEHESGFEVIGDGTTVYKFQGLTMDPNDLWDENETYLDFFKIENAVKGTRLSDLCSLVGGMGSGTEIVLRATDGWETRLPYSSIYPDPSVYARQGDAILAWWSDGEYVPSYQGYRLFFTPEDRVYGQWDMHETLPEQYWHYNTQDGIEYPSCAGLSAKYVAEIRVYSIPEGDWTLQLDGREIGGLNYDVSKTYFESALTCTFGADHKEAYTDSKGKQWEGMPLWFLCGFVDDQDQHSKDAFNEELALAGYKVIITAADGTVVTLDSADIIRSRDYIVANTVDGLPIPEGDKSWPLRLVGPNLSGKQSVGGIVSIRLEGSGATPIYETAPVTDDAYTAGTTGDGITALTVNSGVSGFKYFAVNIIPVIPHGGNETVVFTHLRNGVQMAISAVRADFDQPGVDSAQAGFNVQPGDVIKIYLVDELNNSSDHNPIVLQ